MGLYFSGKVRNFVLGLGASGEPPLRPRPSEIFMESVLSALSYHENRQFSHLMDKDSDKTLHECLLLSTPLGGFADIYGQVRGVGCFIIR